METNKSLRVLVAEDHEPCARLLEIVICRVGYAAVVTRTVEEALAALAQEHFDILICDLLLPDGYGFEIIRAVRNRKPKILSIAITGLGDLDMEIAALAEGFDHFIHKPFTLRKIEALLVQSLI